MNGGSAARRFVIPTVRIRARTIRSALIRGALPALAGALVLAGCGSSGGSAAAASPSASASAAATASAGLSAFETCLKQHGAKVTPGQFPGRPTASFSPRPVPTGLPRPRPSFTGANSAAFKACAKYAPAGFGAGANRAISASALAAFKSCLSANGVKVTGSTASAVLSELRNSTGKTATAVRTCQVLIRPTAPTPLNGDLRPRLPSGSARVVSRRARRPPSPGTGRRGRRPTAPAWSTTWTSALTSFDKMAVAWERAGGCTPGMYCSRALRAPGSVRRSSMVLAVESGRCLR